MLKCFLHFYRKDYLTIYTNLLPAHIYTNAVKPLPNYLVVNYWEAFLLHQINQIIVRVTEGTAHSVETNRKAIFPAHSFALVTNLPIRAMSYESLLSEHDFWLKNLEKYFYFTDSCDGSSIDTCCYFYQSKSHYL